MFELINKNIKPATISKLIELEEYSFFKSLKLFSFKALATSGLIIWNIARPGISTTVAINTATA